MTQRKEQSADLSFLTDNNYQPFAFPGGEFNGLFREAQPERVSFSGVSYMKWCKKGSGFDIGSEPPRSIRLCWVPPGLTPVLINIVLLGFNIQNKKGE